MDNLHTQIFTITQAERAKLHGHSGKVIWFTGLSGSGKSTLANALEIALYQTGKRTYLLDGDNIRQGLNKDLGFSNEDRIENIRRIAEVARLMVDAGLIVITAFISPFAKERELAKEVIGRQNFIEIYVNTPIEICEARDPKGLYLKARAGKIAHFSGISSPYEPPIKPYMELNASGSSTPKTLISQLMQKLENDSLSTSDTS
jgi:bifunctional enzyme CysN/CysC